MVNLGQMHMVNILRAIVRQRREQTKNKHAPQEPIVRDKLEKRHEGSLGETKRGVDDPIGQPIAAGVDALVTRAGVLERRHRHAKRVQEPDDGAERRRPPGEEYVSEEEDQEDAGYVRPD